MAPAPGRSHPKQRPLAQSRRWARLSGSRNTVSIYHARHWLRWHPRSDSRGRLACPAQSGRRRRDLDPKSINYGGFPSFESVVYENQDHRHDHAQRIAAGGV